MGKSSDASEHYLPRCIDGGFIRDGAGGGFEAVPDKFGESATGLLAGELDDQCSRLFREQRE